MFQFLCTLNITTEKSDTDVVILLAHCSTIPARGANTGGNLWTIWSTWQARCILAELNLNNILFRPMENKSYYCILLFFGGELAFTCTTFINAFVKHYIL